VSNQLTKADAARKRDKKGSNSLLSALRYGGPFVWLSCIVMGLGNLVAGQFIKGLIFIAIEAAFAYLIFMPQGCLERIMDLPELCKQYQTEVWDEFWQINISYFNDPSWLVLLYGVIGIVIIGALIVIWQATVRSGYLQISKRREGKHVNNFWEDIKALFDENIHKLLMILPTACIAVFTILPLLYMMSMAFTNYSKVTDNLVLFDWVGFENFKALFDTNNAIGSSLAVFCCGP
jgi:arabinogalactan oligomer/maltooligosaccharide transport system permease protein